MECYGCGKNSVQKKYKKQGHIFFQCKNCGLLFTDFNQEMANYDFYDKEYTSKRTLCDTGSPDSSIENFRRKSAQRLLSQIKEYALSKSNLPLKLLDIGCGEGYFLEVARDNNFEIYGTEISPHAAELASKRLGKPVFLGPLINADFQEGYFDIVCLIDVIEHFNNPCQQIRRIHRILKKGGLLCIHTPNLNSLYSKVMGQRWFQIKPREHLFYFSDRSLPILLNRFKFNVRTLKATGIYVTPRYLANILSETNHSLARTLSLFFKISGLFDKIIYIHSGHMFCIATKEP